MIVQERAPVGLRILRTEENRVVRRDPVLVRIVTETTTAVRVAEANLRKEQVEEKAAQHVARKPVGYD